MSESNQSFFSSSQSYISEISNASNRSGESFSKLPKYNYEDSNEYCVYKKIQKKSSTINLNNYGCKIFYTNGSTFDSRFNIQNYTFISERRLELPCGNVMNIKGGTNDDIRTFDVKNFDVKDIDIEDMKGFTSGDLLSLFQKK